MQAANKPVLRLEPVRPILNYLNFFYGFIIGSILPVLFFYLNATGLVTEADLLEFAGVVITVMGAGLTLALAILALQAFGQKREIDKLTMEAHSLHQDISFRARGIDEIASIVQLLADEIIGLADVSEMKFVDQNQSDDHKSVNVDATSLVQDQNKRIYKRLIHIRHYLRMLGADSDGVRIDAARDIIGSAHPYGDVQIIKRTIRFIDHLESLGEDLCRVRDELVTLGSEAMDELRKVD